MGPHEAPHFPPHGAVRAQLGLFSLFANQWHGKLLLPQSAFFLLTDVFGNFVRCDLSTLLPRDRIWERRGRRRRPGGAGIQSSPIPSSHCSAKQKGNKTLEWKRSIKRQRNSSAIQVVGRDGTWSFIFVGFFNYYFGFFVGFVCLGFLENWGFFLFLFTDLHDKA